METAFYMWFVPKCYKQGQSSYGAEELSAVQMSEATRSSWLVSERAQLRFGSVESQPVKRRIGCWCEMAASPGPHYLSCQLTRVLHGRLSQEDQSADR
jgi:hypothetical protein